LAGVKQTGEEQRAAGEGMGGYHKAVLALISLVLVGSLALRAWSHVEAPARTSESSGAPLASGLTRDVPGGSVSSAGEAASEPAPEPGWQAALPGLTEGSFFALIGFALGYTTMKLFKVALVLGALAFVGTQALVHFGYLEVDWSAVVAKLNQLLLNARENGTARELLTDRIPAAGGMLTGYLLGLRRG
jgi:uncharacterized membrane protein (Fun14 family)